MGFMFIYISNVFHVCRTWNALFSLLYRSILRSSPYRYHEGLCFSLFLLSMLGQRIWIWFWEVFSSPKYVRVQCFSIGFSAFFIQLCNKMFDLWINFMFWLSLNVFTCAFFNGDWGLWMTEVVQRQLNENIFLLPWICVDSLCSQTWHNESLSTIR